MLAKQKIKYVCTSCGAQSGKWSGKCFQCGEWDTIQEEVEYTGSAARGLKNIIQDGGMRKARALSEIDAEDYERYLTGIGELDRVFGGGLVKGSFILISGEPGVGKSTLLSDLVNRITTYGPVLYSSGEESEGQGKKRFDERMGIKNDNIKLLHTTDIDVLEHNANELKPVLMIVDSIQTIAQNDISSPPGSVTQVSTAAIRLMNYAKTTGVIVIVIGQVLKDNKIAGPRQFEHMVDTVLYLEGEKNSDLRLLRVIKNRFGSAHELGVFQMEEEGLVEITNPSSHLLENRLKNATGSAISCISDTRPLLVELQALSSAVANPNSNARRTSKGFDRNQLNIILAVLEKRCGLELTYRDVYVNVVGGMEIDEPGTDLAMAMAVYSSTKNLVIDSETVILGEIGLTGEVRPVGKIEQIVKEIERQGFTRCVLPKGNFTRVKDKVTSLRLVPVETVEEAIKAIF